MPQIMKSLRLVGLALVLALLWMLPAPEPTFAGMTCYKNQPCTGPGQCGTDGYCKQGACHCF